jgi:nicotinamide-nucleotide amidase
MQQIPVLAARLGDALFARDWQMATAESCTGGGIAASLTDIPGSSAWFDRGFVTYSNASKQEMLGVQADTLAAHGAVSEAVVRQMAEGALTRSHARLAVSVSGIAGPGGATPAKPVGTVWVAWAGRDMATRARRYQFDGDRQAVRRQAVEAALQGLLDCLD